MNLRCPATAAAAATTTATAAAAATATATAAGLPAQPRCRRRRRRARLPRMRPRRALAAAPLAASIAAPVAAAVPREPRTHSCRCLLRTGDIQVQGSCTHAQGPRPPPPHHHQHPHPLSPTPRTYTMSKTATRTSSPLRARFLRVVNGDGASRNSPLRGARVTPNQPTNSSSAHVALAELLQQPTREARNFWHLVEAVAVVPATAHHVSPRRRHSQHLANARTRSRC